MTITRDFYYVAPGKHVTHFRNECASYLKSFNHSTTMKRQKSSPFYLAQPKSKTLCDHCQAIEKRLKRIAKAKARRAKRT